MATVKLIVHEFNMGDCEDPYLIAGFPIHEWEQTEMGQWFMKHKVGDGIFDIIPSPTYMGYLVRIRGELEEQDYTYFQLRWGNKSGCTKIQ
jgi:hypothetical protein